jgi:hypothetical protein
MFLKIWACSGFSFTVGPLETFSIHGPLVLQGGCFFSASNLASLFLTQAIDQTGHSQKSNKNQNRNLIKQKSKNHSDHFVNF